MNRTRSLSCALLLVVTLMAFIAMGEAVPRKCPPYETYTECGGSCQTECATLNQPCLIRHIRCPDGCYCNEGYARNNRGKCIPIAQC